MSKYKHALILEMALTVVEARWIKETLKLSLCLRLTEKTGVIKSKFRGQRQKTAVMFPCLLPTGRCGVILEAANKRRASSLFQKPTLGLDLLENNPSGAEAEIISV